MAEIETFLAAIRAYDFDSVGKLLSEESFLNFDPNYDINASIPALLEILNILLDHFDEICTSTFVKHFISSGFRNFFDSFQNLDEIQVAFGLSVTNKASIDLIKYKFANILKCCLCLLQKSNDCKIQREILELFRKFTYTDIIDRLDCAITTEQLAEIASLLTTLFENDQICVEFHWFGGHTHSSTLGSQVVLKVAVVLAFELIVLLPKTHSQELGKIVSAKFSSALKLVQLFLDQDDLLLEMLYCCAVIYSSKKIDFPMLSPHRLWLSLLIEINFDYDLLIDWLSSESMTVRFLLLYFKILSNEFEIFREAASEHYPEPKIKHGQSPKPCKAEKFMTIRVEENVSGVVRNLEVKLCQNAFCDSKSTTTHLEQQSVDSLLQRNMDLLVRMRLQLDKLSKAGLFPFNVKPLIKRIEHIESLCETTTHD